MALIFVRWNTDCFSHLEYLGSVKEVGTCEILPCGLNLAKWAEKEALIGPNACLRRDDSDACHYI